jgi:hypothetical protein
MDVVIPPNTTAQIYVPSTNASAVTESGTLASSSPGVTYLGSSNNYAIYAVGSGHYVWSSPFSISVAPSLITSSTNVIGSGSGTFFPAWTFVTNGSLIAGQSPGTAMGNFSEEQPGRDVKSLTAGGSLGIANITGTSGRTTSTNYVTCGNGNGAGSVLIYTLSNSPGGYDLTNITVYGGWADSGRDQQAYSVYYSTVSAPANFLPLGVVNFNPTIAGSVQSATRITLTHSSGVLAMNVAALKFDFTSPGSENGYCGYAGINVFGTASIPPVVPATLGTVFMTSSGYVMTVGNLVVGRNYTLQSTTNLASTVWSAETNFVATTTTVTVTNSTGSPQKFYRIVGN